MKRIIFLFVILGLAGLVYSQETEDLDKRIDKLIEKLGDEDWKTREEAEKELRQIGKPALKKLRKAKKDPDAERAYRARRLIREIKEDLKSKALQDAPFKYLRHRGGLEEVTIDRTKRRIVVKIRRYRGGKWKTKIYRARSEKEFRRKYPSIAKRYGIGQRKKKCIIEGILKELRECEKMVEEELKKARERQKKLDKLFKQRFKNFEFEFDFDVEPFDFRFFELPRVLPREIPKKNERKPSPRERNTRKIKKQSGISVRPADETLRKQLGFGEDEGVVVKGVKKGTVGDALGLKKHDVILSVNGEKVCNVWEFRLRMNEAIKEGFIRLKIKRAGKDKRLYLNLR